MTQLLTKTCAEVLSKPIDWLWKPFLARGKLAILDGEPGCGKSLLTIDLAARLSRGDPLPNRQPLSRPHTTLLLSAEGDPSDTVRPRAVAAGADLSRVIVAGVGGKAPLPQLPECAEQLAQAINQHAIDLVVIDPITAFLPRVLTTTDQRIREGLAPLVDVAQETGCAVLLVRHLNRSVGPNAAFRGSGSTGLLSLARTGMLVSRHPDDPEVRVLAMSKAYLGPPPVSLGFRLLASDSCSSIQWCGAVDLSADELCISQTSQLMLRPCERAVEFLKAELANGPRLVSELEKLAKKKGLSWKTVKRAKKVAYIQSERVVEGNHPIWQWYDPEQRRAATASRLLPILPKPPSPADAVKVWEEFFRLRKEEKGTE